MSTNKFDPIYNLTVEGIEEAMDYLRTGGKNQYTTVQMLKGLAYSFFLLDIKN